MLRRINILLTLGFLLLSFCREAVNAQVFASVELSKKSVYVQQPFRVTITVCTKTWFTAPLEFTNLQIPNAFIIPFDKTQPGMFTSGGKQYPGVQFYYIVFPYKPGEFTIPTLEIAAQSPPEGSATSRKVVIHTQEQHYTVKDVPADLKNKGEWFVAKDVLLKNSWSSNLKGVKAGDVIKRTITIDAKGTLPQFIPDLSAQENIDWASTYPQSPVLLDTRGGGDVNGRSTQITTYLFDKAGSFTIPAVNISYWNPYSGKIQTASIPQQTLQVAENPNLGILTTLKDSLSATAKPTVKTSETKKPFLILGMKWYQFAGLCVAVIFIGILLIRLGKKIYKKLRAKRHAYLQSERYLFKQVMKSENNPQQQIPALYRWWDSILQKPSASIGASLNEVHMTDEEAQVKAYLTEAYSKQNGNPQSIKSVLKKVRLLFTRNKKPISDNSLFQ